MLAFAPSTAADAGSPPDVERLFDMTRPAFGIRQPHRPHAKLKAPTLWQQPDMWLKAVIQHQFARNRSEVSIGKPKKHNHFLVNLGAHYGNGIDDIVSYSMQSNDVDGYAVDSDDGMPWAGARIRKHTGFVNPPNIAKLLKDGGVPKSPRLLKVDIDSYDADVAAAALATISPLFVFVELNEKIPPPMSYCNRYPDNGKWVRVDGHAYGCSLTGFVNLFLSKGYLLVSVILNDALFVRSDQARAVAAQLPGGALPEALAAFDQGYAHYPHRAQLFPWNEGVKAWIDGQIPLATRANMVRNYFQRHGNGEAKGMTYPFVPKAMPGVWPCAADTVTP